MLKAFAELRQSNAISDSEYDRLKARVLSSLEQRVMPEPVVGLKATAAPESSQGIQDYAGDLHRLIAEKLAREYPSGDKPQDASKQRYLMDMAALLIDKSALHPSDMSHMAKVIETTVDQNYSSSQERLVQGWTQLNVIHNEVRLSTDSSPLAKTITGIASESAAKAVAEATAPSGTETTQAAQTQRSRWWGAVWADVSGAFTGAGTAATILAVPGFPMASLAVLGAAGPAAAVVPVLGALIGASMMSGIDLARTR
jgi:hypothetical protein